MQKYKKTIKKYNNKKSKNNKSTIILTNNNSTGNKITTQNTDQNKELINKKESKNDDSIAQGKTQSKYNSNLKQNQNQDTLAHKKDKYKTVIYCIIAGLITTLVCSLTINSVFSKTLTNLNSNIFLIGKPANIIIFVLYFICIISSICLLTASNKTDNTAYTVFVVLYTILLLLTFSLHILMYGYSLFIPSAIISIIMATLSIYLCYKYFVSYTYSGIIQCFASLVLLYSIYVNLGFIL